MTDTDPYVPDLMHIKSAYVDGRRDDLILSQDAEAEFDRWMATHAVVDLTMVDADALLPVYEEGYAAAPDTVMGNLERVHGIRAVLAHLGLEAS